MGALGTLGEAIGGAEATGNVWPFAVGALVGALVLAAVAVVLGRGWKVDASVKATTSAQAISFAAGASLAGLSASAAALLGGPGVIAVHLRAREIWRVSIARVSVEAFFEWLDGRVSEPEAPPGRIARLIKRVRDGLVARTELTELPGLGLKMLLGLREVSLRGDLLCGFSDPVLTGKAAAVLYPLAGVLAPLGVFDLAFDWSGKDRVDGGAELSFRFVPARIGWDVVVFAWRHVRLFRPATVPVSITT